MAIQSEKPETAFPNCRTVSLPEIPDFLWGLSAAQKCFFSEVCCLVLVMPATNSVSERSFSAMQRFEFETCEAAPPHSNYLGVFRRFRRTFGGASAHEF